MKQPARSPLTSKKRVRVSDEPPAFQDPVVFSSDEEDASSAGGGKVAGTGKDMRGEWPHVFKFRPQLRGRKCTVCSKDFVRICIACGKCIDCFRGGNRECVEGAEGAATERRQSPPPLQALSLMEEEEPSAREWPEYPKTMTRLV